MKVAHGTAMCHFAANGNEAIIRSVLMEGFRVYSLVGFTYPPRSTFLPKFLFFNEMLPPEGDLSAQNYVF